MKVLAKDAKAGQWYEDRNSSRMLCVDASCKFVRKCTGVFAHWNNEELTRLPNCDGWDWRPPKPEPKYRPFANAAEFMPHRGRWIYFCGNQSNQLLPYSISDRGIWHAARMTDWESLLAQAKFADDGTPFGVEVTE